MKYTSKIAKTTKDTKILTDILMEGKNDNISCYAAGNRNCPPEILAKVLKRGEDNSVSENASKNPNCPPEMLIEILRRENDDYVSFNAIKNLNCPPEAKIKWMQVTGRIKKEDPTKHIIEYENNKEDDFQDLKDLL